MHFIKVYYMHEILQLILNKNVHGDNPPPQKKNPCTYEIVIPNDFYCTMYAKQTFRLSHCLMLLKLNKTPPISLPRQIIL